MPNILKLSDSTSSTLKLNFVSINDKEVLMDPTNKGMVHPYGDALVGMMELLDLNPALKLIPFGDSKGITYTPKDIIKALHEKNLTETKRLCMLLRYTDPETATILGIDGLLHFSIPKWDHSDISNQTTMMWANAKISDLLKKK